MPDFLTDGLTLFDRACSAAELCEFEAVLAPFVDQGAGVRLHAVAGLADLLSGSGGMARTARGLLDDAAVPVRAILFDKTDATNWGLGWHQDRTIVVKKRVEVADFGPWTVKSGLLHVAPPIEILQAMVTLRLHLDDVDEANAPLLAAVGSHRLGRIAENDIDSIVGRSRIDQCLAQRGDIWAYSTPILHASDAARAPRRRRVLQVDYANSTLPGRLEWLGLEPA
jgi:Phytanoyl-CoA dioxygenase (PhyH)